MDVLRVVDAFCASCDDVRPHAVMSDDPSSCFCNRCGTCQTLVSPLGPAGDAVSRLVRRGRHSRPERGEIWFSDRRRASPEGLPRRRDVWSADNALAGLALLAEAMETQNDPETLRLGTRLSRATLEAIRRRRAAPEAGVEGARPVPQRWQAGQ